MALAALSILAAALPAQSPPFSTAINLATSPRLGYIHGTQLGDPTTTLLTPCCWCEQDVYLFAPPNTAQLMPGLGWHPTVGHQIVIATEGYRCPPFPPFQPYFPVGSHVPLIGVAFPTNPFPVTLAGGAVSWDTLWLDSASAVIEVPPYVVVDYGPMAYQRFLATIDVPADPTLAGTGLEVQAFRVDPYDGAIYASRSVVVILR